MIETLVGLDNLRDAEPREAGQAEYELIFDRAHAFPVPRVQRPFKQGCGAGKRRHFVV